MTMLPFMVVLCIHTLGPAQECTRCCGSAWVCIGTCMHVCGMWYMQVSGLVHMLTGAHAESKARHQGTSFSVTVYPVALKGLYP